LLQDLFIGMFVYFRHFIWPRFAKTILRAAQRERNWFKLEWTGRPIATVSKQSEPPSHRKPHRNTYSNLLGNNRRNNAKKYPWILHLLLKKVIYMFEHITRRWTGGALQSSF